MPAVALPELIVPGDLYVPNGLEGPLSIEAAQMPNGDDCARITEGTGTENFMAYQDSIGPGTAARADHLLMQNACAMSFWIRRNQAFDSGAPNIPPQAVTTTGIQPTHRFIMGVMDPTTISLPAPQDRRVSWAFVTYSTTSILFIMDGYYANSAYYWATSALMSLPEGEWQFIVVNREAADWSSNANSSPQGRPRVWFNGNLGYEPPSLWKLFPNPANQQRFCIGDGTTLGQTAGGAAPGPAWDISKLCFHDRELTPEEILALMESMKYGPGGIPAS